MGYVKLFGSILDSTVWRTPPAVTKVWIALLAMADRDGEVAASVPGLADRAKVSRRVCERALRIFLAPDRDSRTKDDDGRRLREVDGGWLILNYEKYRDKLTSDEARKKNAARQARWKARHMGNVTNVTVTHSVSASPASPADQIRVGSAPLPRRRPEPDRLVAGTDAKIAELRAIADKPLTPEEVEGLRALRTGNGTT